MRIRIPFAAAFLGLLLLAGYVGLTPLSIPHINDKLLHFVAFLVLTTAFYWILDTSRRRNLHLTLIVCTVVLGIGSEFLQDAIPNNDRNFDVMDIAYNVGGSLCALGLSSLYHKRMLDRKRKSRGYGLVPGDEEGAAVDVELGEALTRIPTTEEQDGGVVPAHIAPVTTPTLEEEVENWDENQVDDWVEEDVPAFTNGEASKSAGTDFAGEADIGQHVAKKRID